MGLIISALNRFASGITLESVKNDRYNWTRVSALSSLTRIILRW